MWLSTLALLIYSLTTELLGSFQASKEAENEIDTSISLQPIGEVDFPSVVISSGGPIDPLGFVTNTKNMVTEEELPERGKDGSLFYYVLELTIA